MKILQTDKLHKHYGQGDNLVKAVNGIDLTVAEGEFVAIVGTSGSGKSTLLHMIGGLERPTSGQIYINKQNIYTMNEEQLSVFRRRQMGFIFQAYNLIPILTAWENIILPLELDGKAVDTELISELIHTLNIYDKRSALPNQLSGGQQQRVAIARALANRPALVLADEPTGNLDSKTSLEVMNLLRHSVNKYHQTLVMITHNDMLARLADRVIRLEDGMIV